MALETFHTIEENEDLTSFKGELRQLKKKIETNKKNPEKKEELSDKQQQKKIEIFRKKIDDLIFQKTAASNGASFGGEKNIKKEGKEVYMNGGSGDGGQWTELSYKKNGVVMMKYSAKTHQDQDNIPGRSTSIQISIGKETMKYTHVESTNKTTHNNYKLMGKAQKYFKEIESTCK